MYYVEFRLNYYIKNKTNIYLILTKYTQKKILKMIVFNTFTIICHLL